MFHFSCVVKKCSALHNSVDILNPSFNKKMWKIMTVKKQNLQMFIKFDYFFIFKYLMLVSTEEELLVQISCMTFSEWTTLKHRQLGGLYVYIVMQLSQKLLESCCHILY